MRIFQVTVMGDRYPMTYNITASSWSVAASRAVKQWQKRFKRSQTDTLKLHIVKGGIVEPDNSKQ